MSERLTFLFTKDELSSIFGDLRRAERIKQRIFHLNKIGENLGIRLAFSSVDSTLAIYCPALTSAQKLKERLIAGKGHIQRAMGQILAKKLDVVKKPSLDILSFLLRHTSWWREVFEEISGPKVFIETRSNIEIKQALAQNPWQSLLVLGPAASGKSALLFKSFHQKAEERLNDGEALPVPVYLPACHLSFDSANPENFLSSISCLQSESKGELIGLLDKGRILFFIDGLDENPKSVDFSNPLVCRFWIEVSKNVCVLSSRKDFWDTQVKKALFSQFFAKIKNIHLGEWSLDEAQDFLKQLAQAYQTESTETKACLDHLSELDSGNLKKLLDGVPKTPLNIRAFAQFVATNKGRLPKQNKRLLDFISQTTLRWEAEKPQAQLSS